jgi:hypothetical protein
MRTRPRKNPPCPILFAFLAKRVGKQESNRHPPIAPMKASDAEPCRRASSRRLLGWRRRENLASSHGYRFRFRLRSLLRFFSAFIFASHAASMTQPPAPEKSRKRFPAPHQCPAPADAPCPILPAPFAGRVGNHECRQRGAGPQSRREHGPSGPWKKNLEIPAFRLGPFPFRRSLVC